MSESNPSDVDVLSEAVRVLGSNAAGVNESVSDLADAQRGLVVSQGKTRKVLWIIAVALATTIIALSVIIVLQLQSRQRGIKAADTNNRTATVVSRIDNCLNGKDVNCYVSVANAAGTISVAKLVDVLPCFADPAATAEQKSSCVEVKLNYDVNGNGAIGG